MKARVARLCEGAPEAADTDPGPTALERSLDAIPAEMKPRTLLLVLHESPHYVDRLAPAEQAAYSALLPAIVSVMEARGIAAEEIGKSYTAADFISGGHLSEEGGRKMARDVAPRVRELAQRLGYLKPPGD